MNNTKKRQRRRKKHENKQELAISLYIDGIPYEHGLICTFCTKRVAVTHCSACSDFYCSICDATVHGTKKRKDHHRSVISKLDLNRASRLITKTFRFNYHLKELQRRCRLKFKRHFDRVSLNHYYYNTVYNTVSWRKPYCLRKLELLPFFTPDYAASLIQG